MCRLIAEAQGGGAVDPSRQTVDDYLTRFERDWVALHVTRGSARRYRQCLAHVRQHLGGRRLQQLRPAEVSRHVCSAAHEGLSARTIKLVHTVLHRALAQARIWGVIRDNPVELVRAPKVPDREMEMPTAGRGARSARAAARHSALSGCPLGIGHRRPEERTFGVALGPTLSSTPAASQVATAFEGNGTGTVKSPKTKSGRRTITLPAGAIAELRIHKREQQERRLAAGGGRAPVEAYVFSDDTGRPIRPNLVTKWWARLVPEFTMHVLRHVHASLLIAAGVDIVTVSRRLGHSSPTITLKAYAHLVHGTDARAAEIVDEVLSGKIG